MKLNIGMHTGPQRCTFDELRRLWRIADSTGFYQVSVWDHFYDDPSPDGSGPNHEAVSTLGALASETKNVRVGVYAFCVGYRHPAVLAKTAATLDQMSDGRFELGLGAGWMANEYAAYGIPFPSIGVRMDMLEEAVQIIKSMLTKRTTTFKGKHFQLENAFCEPKPVQKKPKIWVCGAGEKRTLNIAAKYGDAWNIPYPSPEVFAQKRQVLDDWCGKLGRDSKEIYRTVNVGLFMGTNATDAKKKRRVFEEMFGERAAIQGSGMLLGTPQEVVDRIGAYADAGAEGLNIVLRAPVLWDSLQSFIEEVKPAFK
jgi:F420-dependent oxidoreductase-like protein